MYTPKKYLYLSYLIMLSALSLSYSVAKQRSKSSTKSRRALKKTKLTQQNLIIVGIVAATVTTCYLLARNKSGSQTKPHSFLLDIFGEVQPEIGLPDDLICLIDSYLPKYKPDHVTLYNTEIAWSRAYGMFGERLLSNADTFFNENLQDDPPYHTKVYIKAVTEEAESAQEQQAHFIVNPYVRGATYYPRLPYIQEKDGVHKVDFEKYHDIPSNIFTKDKIVAPGIYKLFHTDKNGQEQEVETVDSYGNPIIGYAFCNLLPTPLYEKELEDTTKYSKNLPITVKHVAENIVNTNQSPQSTQLLISPNWTVHDTTYMICKELGKTFYHGICLMDHHIKYKLSYMLFDITQDYLNHLLDPTKKISNVLNAHDTVYLVYHHAITNESGVCLY